MIFLFWSFIFSFTFVHGKLRSFYIRMLLTNFLKVLYFKGCDLGSPVSIMSSYGLIVRFDGAVVRSAICSAIRWSNCTTWRLNISGLTIPRFDGLTIYRLDDSTTQCRDSTTQCCDSTSQCRDSTTQCRDSTTQCRDSTTQCSDSMTQCCDPTTWFGD